MRLFAAVFPPLERAEALVQTLISARMEHLRCVDPETAHFTLAFIGEASAEQGDKACSALARAAVGVPAFEASFGELGAFDSWQRPKILWIGLKTGGLELTRLAQRVREELASEGISFDSKPFVPHMTLARLKGGRVSRDLQFDLERALRPERLASMRIAAADLMSSRTLPSGPVYSTVRRQELAVV